MEEMVLSTESFMAPLLSSKADPVRLHTALVKVCQSLYDLGLFFRRASDVYQVEMPDEKTELVEAEHIVQASEGKQAISGQDAYIGTEIVVGISGVLVKYAAEKRLIIGKGEVVVRKKVN